MDCSSSSQHPFSEGTDGRRKRATIWKRIHLLLITHCLTELIDVSQGKLHRKKKTAVVIRCFDFFPSSLLQFHVRTNSSEAKRLNDFNSHFLLLLLALFFLRKTDRIGCSPGCCRRCGNGNRRSVCLCGGTGSSKLSAV
jgi:hypothetical protein